jgi:CBS domain-containing protein
MSYRVKDYMDREFPTIETASSVVEAAKAMAKAVKSYLIVLDKGSPKGMLTEDDLVRKVLAVEKDPKKLKVSDVMSSPLITVDPDEDLIKASEIMQKNGIKRLPVVKEGIIYGVLTSQNIAQKCGAYVEKSVKDILRWSFPIG